MLTGGHIAASYLIAETAKSFGVPVTASETIQIIIAGNIVDIDFFVGLINGKTGEEHHQNITHTPLGAVTLLILLSILFDASVVSAALLGISLFIHLILDDVGYWMYKLGIYKSRTNSQVNWFYPFNKFQKHNLIKGNKEVLKFYLVKAWPVAVIEILLVLIAVIVFLK